MADHERPEGHDTLLTKGTCPHCNEEKAYATYADGHSYCFAEGKTYWPDGSGVSSHPREEIDAELLDPAKQIDPWQPNKKRHIGSDTLRKMGSFTAGFKGGSVRVYPIYNQAGELAAQKLRDPFKNFPLLKGAAYQALADCWLVFRNVWGDRFDKQVVITEGEEDALACVEAGVKGAVVSLTAGISHAVRNIKANYLWLDRFTEIVIWFDNEEEAQKIASECAALFKIGKVRIAKASGFCADGKTLCKDASDIKQAGRPGDILTCIYAATAWRPKGIVNAKDSSKSILAPREEVLSFRYPPMMPRLQEMTGGMHMGEVIYHVAGTGVGKSTGLREIEFHLLEQDCKISILSFEDTTRDAQFGLMSIRVNERLHLYPVPERPKEKDFKDDPKGYAAALIEWEKACVAYDAKMLPIHASVFASGQVELFDQESAEWNMEAILGYVRYCAKGLDCKVIFIDPISFVAAGIELTADERRVLDKVAAEFAKMAKELNVHLQIAHHLKRTQGIPHEEGAPTSLNELRSSGGLANFAMGVIGWERNNQASGDAWRVTQSRIIKPVRRTGKSGLADLLYYGDNGRLVQSQIPFPPIGKPDGDGEGSQRSKGFAPVGETDY